MAPQLWKLQNLQRENSFESLPNGTFLLTQQEGPLRGSHSVRKPEVHKCLSQFEAPFPSRWRLTGSVHLQAISTWGPQDHNQSYLWDTSLAWRYTEQSPKLITKGLAFKKRTVLKDSLLGEEPSLRGKNIQQKTNFVCLLVHHVWRNKLCLKKKIQSRIPDPRLNKEVGSCTWLDTRC